MDNQQQVNRENITDALAAFKSGSPSDIVDAISILTDTEKMVVKIIQEITAPPVKARRSDAGVPRKKAEQKTQTA